MRDTLSDEDRFDPLALTRAAAARLGIPCEAPAVLRRSSSVLVELAGQGIIARIERPGAEQDARRQVFAARWLEARRFPAARLVQPERQPVFSSAGIVTFWRALQIVDGRPDAAVLGRLARRLHESARPDPPPEAQPIDPFGPTRGYLALIERQAKSSGVMKLAARLDRLERRWEGVRDEDPLGATFVHGDFHHENVVLTPSGPVLLDLETAGLGPASWDIVPQLVATRRFGAAPGLEQAFLEGYGADPTAWSGIDVFCDVYELFLGLWAIAYSEASPAMTLEARVRRATLLGESDASWTLI